MQVDDPVKVQLRLLVDRSIERSLLAPSRGTKVGFRVHTPRMGNAGSSPSHLPRRGYVIAHERGHVEGYASDVESLLSKLNAISGAQYFIEDHARPGQPFFSGAEAAIDYIILLNIIDAAPIHQPVADRRTREYLTRTNWTQMADVRSHGFNPRVIDEVWVAP